MQCFELAWFLFRWVLVVISEDVWGFGLMEFVDGS